MRAIIIFLSFIITMPASAKDDWDFAWEHKNKCSKGGMTNMSLCLAKSYRKVDARLNDVYSKLKAKMSNSKPLIKTQRVWIKFRDLECKFTNPPHKGSLYPYAQNACLIDKTEKRIKDLERYLSWSGCNGCPW